MCGEQELIWLSLNALRGSSPRVRGTVLTSCRGLVLRRFIPACAGNRTQIQRSRCLMAVHPRVCGEQEAAFVDKLEQVGSSPRVRGTGKLAYSGRCPPAVHPRVCGEQRNVIAPPDTIPGSSPRVRGTVYARLVHRSGRRFIPACAGNSTDESDKLYWGSVHPRVCGEQIVGKVISTAPHGSSPRVRGTGKAILAQAKSSRFIPACAGNRSAHAARAVRQPVHPRVCGEQPSSCDSISSFRGSSPRVRGTVDREYARRGDYRFIPACAGNSQTNKVSISPCTVHPRVCGEQRSAR